MSFTIDEHLFIGFMNPTAGREDEYAQWYANYHVPEVVRHVLGFRSGRRYRLNPLQRTDPRAGVAPSWEFMTVYRLEGGTDIPAMHQSVIDEAPNFTPGNGVMAEGHRTWVFTPIGEKLVDPRPSPIPGAQTHLFMALTNPAEGREDEYNDWYDTSHLQESLEAIAGRVSGRRYRLNEAQRPGQDPPWRYLALYELQGDDVAALQRADEEVRISGRLTPGNGVVASGSATWLFTAVGDPVVRREEATTGRSV
jgi:hypothetical protein